MSHRHLSKVVFDEQMTFLTPVKPSQLWQQHVDTDWRKPSACQSLCLTAAAAAMSISDHLTMIRTKHVIIGHQISALIDHVDTCQNQAKVKGNIMTYIYGHIVTIVWLLTKIWTPIYIHQYFSFLYWSKGNMHLIHIDLLSWFFSVWFNSQI
jgi:hypothetical protein